ncbi:sec-independent protein translocase protein TatA [Parafrankia irregularis]|uniref:Sec-independent protein translocase protein TatA n=1 Tax=Parafrankia irregularis TaxID=795642 RepID=A0A0S4QGA3_9ACTN|nr:MULTISPECIES: Sec-independent protein translocase subunit TatA [Parafrankia]MBE3201039.1 Sec-independent protein translocase subunit TatA [Parafrankia sp. CH37]CUU54560.1 sec-independent protein translocase protein TatA [Parafrankia irregularis]
MPDLGAPEILIIAIVVLVLFGSKRLPDAARSLGRSMRIFKSEVKGLREDDHSEPAPVATAPAVATAAPVAPAAVPDAATPAAGEATPSAAAR